MDYFNVLLDIKIFGISFYNLLISFMALIATLTSRKVLVNVIFRALEKKAKKTKTIWDDALMAAVRPPLETLVLTYGIWFAISVLPHPTEPLNIKGFVETAGHVLIILIGAWLLYRLVSVVDVVLKEKADDPGHWMELGMLPLISNSIRILVLITSGIVIAQNLGYSVGGLIASLGLGGAALALASKDTISNLFGSLMIVVDKPFKVGDWVRGGDFEGVVEQIGFRSTKIRTFSKTIENIPNNIMANIKVENMDRRKDKGLNVRRIKITLGVKYSTTADQMEKVIVAIKEILKTDPGVDQRQTTLVNFINFGNSSLDIFIYYFSNDASWAYYLDVRERVNLKIMRKLEQTGLEVAFPSSSMYIESIPPQMLGGRSEEKENL